MKKRIRQVNKGIGLFLICLLFLTAFGAQSTAAEVEVLGNTVHIYKLLNGNKHNIHQVPQGELRPYAGAEFTLFKLNEDERKKTIGSKEYDDLLEKLKDYTEEELLKRYPNPKKSDKTNAEGKTTVTGLSDGRYYIVETIGEGKDLKVDQTTVPILLDLPFDDGTGDLKKEISIYTKPNTPDEPPETPEKPEKPTGGYKFYKKVKQKDPNAEDVFLPGVKFEIKKKKTDGSFEKIPHNGSPSYITTSNKNGYFEFTGLPYGEYYVFEIDTPKGYRGITDPEKIEITKDSYGMTATKTIYNTKLPETPPSSPPTTPQGPGGSTPSTPGGTTPGRTTGGYTSTPPAGGKTFTGDIPKTGDIQIYLYAIAGLALISIGTVLYKTEKEKENRL